MKGQDTIRRLEGHQQVGDRLMVDLRGINVDYGNAQAMGTDGGVYF